MTWHQYSVVYCFTVKPGQAKLTPTDSINELSILKTELVFAANIILFKSEFLHAQRAKKLLTISSLYIFALVRLKNLSFFK